MRISPRQQAGFTIIELIVVIVILGILAATALPKFVDISSEAKAAAAAGVAGAAGSAATINYSACQVKNNVVDSNKCFKVRDCTNIAQLLQGGAAPTGYTIAASGAAATAIGGNFECSVAPTDGSASAVGFHAIGAGT